MTAIEWLDHPADAGFRASGETLSSAFCEAARAMFSHMFSIETIDEQTEYAFTVIAGTLQSLLVEWLSELLVQKDLTRLVFSRFEVAVSGDASTGFSAQGRAFGEPLDRVKHRPGVEIKGISYLGLSVERHEGLWVAQVVVDV